MAELNRCIIGDALDVLPTIEAGSVQCCVTSPPYWVLRDYGVSGQLGLEPTPDEYVAKMVAVFREVRRVLRVDGTLWLNLGDSYATGAGGVGECPGGGKQGESWKMRGVMTPPNRLKLPGLKAKDLVGIPWRVAFALQADGWYLRQDIIWHKPNPMPESVRDRCTKAHEYIFLLSKSGRYYFDCDAIAEPVTDDRDPSRKANKYGTGVHSPKRSGNKERKPASARGVPADADGKTAGAVAGSVPWEDATGLRNRRDVWSVSVRPFSGAHFATFPPDLIEPCILAGSKPGDVVLDPFFGSGTTGQVAQALGRQWIGIELNPAYATLQNDRTAQQAMVLA